MNPYVASDLTRYAGSASLSHFLHVYLSYKTFRYQVWMRLSREPGLKGKLARVHFWHYRNWRVQIPCRAQVGYGLYIAHNGPVAVHETAVIGNNCNLSQCVTIGSNHGKAAVIGDNVYIGPNVCVVEDVTIGDNATIGAGSVVTKDIPDNATAAGNYARVLSYDNPGRYIQNRYTPAD